MRRVSFQSVLHGAARLAGLDPTRDLREPATSLFCEHINQRVAEAWRWDFWPEWTLTEERTRTGDEPDGYQFPYAESGLTTMETVKAVYRRNPKLNVRNPWAAEFSMNDEGIVIAAPVPETVWAVFRAAPPKFAVTVWASANSYLTDDLRYYSNSTTEGETYLALQASTNQNPATAAAYWVRVDFPEALAGYVKRAAASDYLRSQKQEDRANQLLIMATQELQDALDRALDSQGQYERAGVVTYGR
jgi:hypothetical protein